MNAKQYIALTLSSLLLLTCYSEASFAEAAKGHTSVKQATHIKASQPVSAFVPSRNTGNEIKVVQIDKSYLGAEQEVFLFLDSKLGQPGKIKMQLKGRTITQLVDDQGKLYQLTPVKPSKAGNRHHR
jgi:hypothetical protein